MSLSLEGRLTPDINRRRFTALTAGSGLGTGLAAPWVRAAEGEPVKLGILTDRAAADSDQTGAGLAAAALLGLQVDDSINVAPDDSDREPVSGRLVALTAHEIVLHRRDARLSDLHAHFPRAGFDVQRAAPAIP